MPEQIQNILNRIREWWGKFTGRQKGIIIGLTIFTIIVFGVIVYVVSRPRYTRLMTCENTTQSNQVVQILESNGIPYQISTDALKIDVETGSLSKAELALAADGYVADEFTVDDALASSLSTTASERAFRKQLYLESRIEGMLENIDSIKSAKITLSIPEQNGTLIAQEEEAGAYVQLETNGYFTSSNAAYVARCVATALGNDTTAKITIVDNNAELLFAGGDEYSTAGIASSMLELQTQAECQVANTIKSFMIGTHQYDNVEVSSHLDMDYSNYEKTVKEYSAPEGRTEGMIIHNENYESENESGVGGIPGTDSNGEGTTYVTSDYDNSSSAVTETETDYAPNESAEYKVTPAGSINYNNSSLSIAAISYKAVHQEDVELQGLLDGITWEEYKLNNSDMVRQTVTDDLVVAVANASGFPAANISIIAYEAPIFYDKEGLAISWTTVLSALLFLLILGLLAFVVLRNMLPGKKPQEEPEEISVEDLLQSNPEPTIEDIDVETKSETRKMIEKFVDENPEAAAILLRNWLADEWG
ncbi:MAG: flagellar M-ring protein FliF [Lachnospiraceae bacterium]|nr:flagellar M-ring protein FliF [Lachnospiraceae bacterium]